MVEEQPAVGARDGGNGLSGQSFRPDVRDKLGTAERGRRGDDGSERDGARRGRWREIRSPAAAACPRSPCHESMLGSFFVHWHDRPMQFEKSTPIRLMPVSSLRQDVQVKARLTGHWRGFDVHIRRDDTHLSSCCSLD
jgi:hypothetical protein